MTNQQPVDYKAVLADLEAKKQQIEQAIAAIRMIATDAAPGPHSGGTGPSAFLGMSIPDATKKHLSAVRQKQSTQEVIKALEAGGLPPAKYSTVYAILRRREKHVGDIINMKGDWALAEWYPHHKKKTAVTDAPAEDDSTEQGEDRAKNAEQREKLLA
ncbi:MAG TPA: hypothetical protein VJR26_04075 [Candidatus Acidoferrales bacterium]|nr:hypothetical protein [Candidatus Acidoferrales bacterium]